MIPFGDSDIPTMFALKPGGFSDPIAVNNVMGAGIVDEEDQAFQTSDGQRGLVTLPVTTVLLQTSAWPDIAIDDPVILDGADYTIRDRVRIHDGAITKILLGTPGNIYDGGFFTDTPGPEIGDALFTPAPTGAPIDGEGF
jgi:hypothetical protein